MVEQWFAGTMCLGLEFLRYGRVEVFWARAVRQPLDLLSLGSYERAPRLRSLVRRRLQGTSGGFDGTVGCHAEMIRPESCDPGLMEFGTDFPGQGMLSTWPIAR